MPPSIPLSLLHLHLLVPLFVIPQGLVPLFVIPQGSAVVLAVARFASPIKNFVISTETAHSVTMSSAAEKPAPPPKPFEPHPLRYLPFSSPKRGKELPPCGHAMAQACI